MGLFDFLGINIEKNKKRMQVDKQDPVMYSIDRIKEHLDNQTDWINSLHADLHEHKNHTKTHLDHHASHLSTTDQWITYLHKNNIELKKDMESLQKSLYSKIRSDFILYNKQLISSIKDHYSSLNIDQLHERMAQMEEKIQNFNKVEYTASKELPPLEIKDAAHINNSQRKILNLLYSSTVPLDYETISSKLGISIISVRVYIKKLKDNGFDIESISSGRKVRVIISNKEKVKKFYNV